MPLFMAFLFGIFSAAFALLAEIVFWSFFPDASAPFANAHVLAPSLVLLLLAAALLEEASKLVFLRQYLLRFRGPSGAPLFFPVLLFGTGFAATEWIVAASSSFLSFSLLGNAAIHIITPFLLLVPLRSSLFLRRLSLLWALLGAVFIHAAYNCALFLL